LDHIGLNKGNKHYNLRIKHCEAQQEYVQHLYKLLEPWVGSSPIKYRDSDGHISVGLETYSSESFSEFGRLFPADATGWKTLPANLADHPNRPSLLAYG